MINLEDRRIYIYGGFALALILLVITLFSFFEKPKYEISSSVNNRDVVENSNQGENIAKIYPTPQISTVSDISVEGNYSIKIYKVNGLPKTVQDIVYSDIEKEKTIFVNKYKKSSIPVVLQSDTPQVYQLGKYASVVTVFSEYESGQLARTKTLCWTYDIENEAMASLPQILETENKNNAIYIYLVSFFKNSLIESVVQKITDSGLDGEKQRSEIAERIESVLTADAKNFSRWYIKDKEIVSIFNSNDFISNSSSSEIIISLNLEGARLYLKSR